MIKVLKIPGYLKRISKLKKETNEKYYIIGCDIETLNGEPYMLQMADEKNDVMVVLVNRETVLHKFFLYIERKILEGNYNIVCFFHNLNFDLVALLYNEDLYKFKKTSFKLEKYNWNIEVYSGKRYFLVADNQILRAKLSIVDSAGFYPFSLKKIAQDLQLPIQKLDRPEGLGEKEIDFETLKKYAEQDAKIEFLVGKNIIEIHNKYGIKLCVSLPQMSSIIFKKYFMREGDVIKLPPKKILEASIRSY